MQSIRTFIFAVGVLTLLSIAQLASRPALAGGCDDMRTAIARMDRESVKPPGYFMLRRDLLMRAIRCQEYPAASEYWYRADGTPTGARASAGRPDDAAYAATPEIGAACARLPNPGVCALDAQVAASCRTPQPDSRIVCEMLFGPDYRRAAAAPNTGDTTIPLTTVTIEGRTYALPSRCNDVLRNASEGADMPPAAVAVMKANCPDFLAALERRTGRDAARDPSGLWPALADLVIANFPPPGAAPVTVARSMPIQISAACAIRRRRLKTPAASARAAWVRSAR